MNSTPPRADSSTSTVFFAEAPIRSLTRSRRPTSTKVSELIAPDSCSTRPSKRATVVFPVPGLPRNRECMLIPVVRSPLCARIWLNRTIWVKP